MPLSIKSLFAAKDMTVGRPWKRIMEFSIPMLLGNVAQQLNITPVAVAHNCVYSLGQRHTLTCVVGTNIYFVKIVRLLQQNCRKLPRVLKSCERPTR